jgi:glycosyltransferase involved in cell wall biosynthesis
MLKIGYFSPVPDLKGGAETSLVDLLGNPDVEAILISPGDAELARVARALGRDVVVLPLGRVAQIRRPVKLANVLPSVWDWIKAARQLKVITRQKGIDVVHSNGLKAHFVSCLCRILGGPPTVIHIHDIPLQRRERILWRMLGVFSDLAFIVSRPCWPEKDPLPDNVHVLYNGLDIHDLPKLPHDEHRHFTIGFCGRLHPYKGVDHLIAWVGHLRDSGIDMRLVIRGECAPEHVHYVEELHREVERLRLQDIVIFEGKKSGLAEIYRGIDVVVVPSVVPDALPRSIMEAMGLGLPVIAYPSGGIVYQIDHGRDGFLVRNKEEFRTVIEQVMREPELTRAISARAIEKVKSSFTIEKMFSTLNQYYKRFD